MKNIRIASRASKLALVQSNYIRDALLNINSDLEISIVTISTKGDRDKSDFLHKTESIGFFTSEIENALLDDRADIAVHSFKDLPTDITKGLTIAAIPKRETVADVLVASGPISSISELPAEATVGTSSLRRIAQLKHNRSDLKCVPLRGNVETRVKKVLSYQIDAAIIAHAGLKRLRLTDNISAILSPSEFLPAPAQGALAVQVRSDDSELAELVSQLDDERSRITTETERYILSMMQGGCSIPLGIYSDITDNIINIDAFISDEYGNNYIRRSTTGHFEQAKSCAEKLAKELLDSGGQEILKQLRNDF